jgi:predicted SAM-dependent methyltransferase
MLKKLFKELMVQTNKNTLPLRLHIGGKEVHKDWKILNIQNGPHVDFVGNCTDLSQFANNSVTEVYASHIIEHLGYQTELEKAIAEIYRVLIPGGTFKISVPDLDVLSRIFLRPDLHFATRFQIMQIMFGGQTDEYDYHKVGLNWEFLHYFLKEAGFTSIEKVKTFDLFDDGSKGDFFGELLSLNVIAKK